MKIQLESTEIMTRIDGTPMRVWNGVTEDGVQCFAFMAYLAFRPEDSPPTDLIEQNPPAFEAASIECPVCHLVSSNRNDILFGYCGRCHDYTSLRS